MNEILIIGYGNPGRGDDGLGPAFADELDKLNITNLVIESDYQLSVEHAYNIAKSKVTILVDAHVSCKEPFEVNKVSPAETFSFSTHSVSPENVTRLAQDMANTHRNVFTIGIRGYDFNSFKEELSKGARMNLKRTLKYITGILKDSNAERVSKLLIKITGRTQE